MVFQSIMVVHSKFKQPIPMSVVSSSESVTTSHILSSQPRVVVEDISSLVNAEKLKRLNKPGNPHSQSGKSGEKPGRISSGQKPGPFRHPGYNPDEFGNTGF